MEPIGDGSTRLEKRTVLSEMDPKARGRRFLPIGEGRNRN
jgi:hypothetical protein